MSHLVTVIFHLSRAPARDRPTWPFAFLLLLILNSGNRAAETDTDLVHAEKTLKEAKLATDGSALLEFFRKRTISEADRAKLAKTVRLLGDESFDVREKASEDLIAAGRSALPFLKSALSDSDTEIAYGVAACLQKIEAN